MKLYFLLVSFLVFSLKNNPLIAQNSISKNALTHQNNPEKYGYRSLGGLLWEFKTKGKIFSSPIVSEGIVYIGSENGNLYALDEKTGKQIWVYKTKGGIPSSPTIYKNTVYFGSFDGNYYALDAKNGNLRWKFKTHKESWMGEKGIWGMKPENLYMTDLWDFFLSSPTVYKIDTTIYITFGSSDTNIYTLDAASGKLLWKFKTQGPVHSSPVVNNNVVYIGSWDSNLYAIDGKNGTEKWRFKTDSKMTYKGIQSSVLVEDGFVYFGARAPYFYALNEATGKLVWKYDTEKSWILSSPTIKDGIVYFGTSDSASLIGLDAKRGEEKFRFKANGYIYGTPAILGNTIYFGDFTGNFYAVNLMSLGIEYNTFSTPNRELEAKNILNNDKLDFSFTAKGSNLLYYANNKKVINEFYKLGPIVSSPYISNNIAFFGSANGTLYAIKIKEPM